MAVRAKFKGDGSEYHTGVPARDLDDNDWEHLDDERKALIAESPLYSLRGEAKADAEQAADKQAAPAPKAKAAPSAKKGA